MRKNGISQQPMNENGIQFLRQKRFWNRRAREERKHHYVMFCIVNILYFEQTIKNEIK